MRFVEYPDEAARNKRAGGVLLEGDKIGLAPPSGDWVMTGDKVIHRVFGSRVHSANGAGGLPSSLATENHYPVGVPRLPAPGEVWE